MVHLAVNERLDAVLFKAFEMHKDTIGVCAGTVKTLTCSLREREREREREGERGREGRIWERKKGHKIGRGKSGLEHEGGPCKHAAEFIV